MDKQPVLTTDTLGVQYAVPDKPIYPNEATYGQGWKRPKVYKVCLTGGPCAGKTSASSMLKDRLSSRYEMFFLPEMASLTIHAGVNIIPSEFTPETHQIFTESIMKVQMELEDYYSAIAAIQKRDVIIICDRGCIDNLAYCSKEVKEKILHDSGWTMEKIRDERYDAVIHLVTAADGAEKFYTLQNNTARSETPEVARWLDKRTQAVWNGHPNFQIISNHKVESFKHKMDEVYRAICRVIDVPEEPTFVRKYLLQGPFDVKMLPPEYSPECFIEIIVFLKSVDPNYQISIKRRITCKTKGETFTLAKRRLGKTDAERLELVRILTPRDYDDLYVWRNKKLYPVTKEVNMFLYQNENCQVETFSYGPNTISTLRTYVMDPSYSNVPPFLPIDKEITEDPEFFTHILAKTKQLDKITEDHNIMMRPHIPASAEMIVEQVYSPCLKDLIQRQFKLEDIFGPGVEFPVEEDIGMTPTSTGECGSPSLGFTEAATHSESQSTKPSNNPS